MFELKSNVFLGLDYIDLRGNYCAVTLEAKDEDDAINCLKKAWDANLLWHFNLNLNNTKPLCKTRTMPFSLDELSELNALQRILLAINNYSDSFAHEENQVINHYESIAKIDYHQIRKLGEIYSQLEALKVVYENLATTLKEKGLNPPRTSTKESEKIIESAKLAAKTLNRMEKAKGDYSSFRPLGYIARANTDNFIELLPKIEGIFAHSGVEGLINE